MANAALLTRMSTDPSSATVSSTMPRACAGSPKSATMVRGASSHGTYLIGDAFDVSPAHSFFVIGKGVGGSSSSGHGDIGASLCEG